MKQRPRPTDAGKARLNPVLIVLCALVLAVGAWVLLRPPGSDASGTGASTATRETASAEATPPNVVIFLIDTLRADRLGTYGYGSPTSPHMDALAEEGVVFEQCGAAAPWTLPSVVSLLTSTFPCEHRVLVDGQRVAQSIKPLAERLKEAGYTTASFYANAYAGAVTGLDRGCDVSRSVRYTDGRSADAWLATIGKGPFFLYAHNIEPHNPYNAPDRLIQHFGAADAEVKKRVMRAYLDYRKLTRADFAAKRPVGTTDNTAAQTRALQALDALKPQIDVLYDATVRQADARMGGVIAALKRRGLWDNTLFIATADHGEELGDHGGWQHDQSAYEELLRVPLVVHFPRGKHAGRRVREAVSLVDLMPTILDAAGKNDLAVDCRGTSLLPLLEGGQLPSRDEFLVTGLRMNRKKYYRPYKQSRGDDNVVVRQGTLKGIWNVEVDGFELYDLQNDPLEQNNLFDRRAELAAAMTEYARSWLERCGRGVVEGEPLHADEMDDETLKSLRSLGYVE